MGLFGNKSNEMSIAEEFKIQLLDNKNNINDIVKDEIRTFEMVILQRVNLEILELKRS